MNIYIIEFNGTCQQGGPCKDEFVAWDECVSGLQKEEPLSKCYDVTAVMMRCMRKHEYYDMMTAGSTMKEDHSSESDKSNITTAS